MKYRIDPTVDCVFKAILASEQNKNLLIDFLNAVMEPSPACCITDVEIMNPYNEKEFLSDKLSIVDIKASDRTGRTYQVEVQIAIYGALDAKMVYGLCDLFASQLREGDGYEKLKPVVAIWVIAGLFFPTKTAFRHHFQLCDMVHKVLFRNYLSLYVLELEKWDNVCVERQIDRWVKFLREGKDLDDADLPEYMQTKEMRQAMSTLRQFSEKERHYHQYQARINYLRERSCIEKERDQAVQELDLAIQRELAAAQELDLAIQRELAAAQDRDRVVQDRDRVVQERDLAVQELHRLRKAFEQG